MRRRDLLRGVAAAPLVLALADCAGQAGVAQYVTDAQTIVSELQADLPALAAIQGMPATAIVGLRATLPTLIGLLGQLQGVVTTTAAQPIVKQIVALVGPIVAAILPFVPGGSALAVALMAVQVLLPILLQQVGVPAAYRPAASEMSPAEARAVLAARAAAR